MSSDAVDQGEALRWACQNGDLDQVRLLVDKQGANINGEIKGRRLLHFAADYGQLDVIEYLCSKGGDVNVEDKHGISPILAAIWEGHTECVKLLLSKGAKKDGKAPDGTSYSDSAETDALKNLLK